MYRQGRLLTQFSANYPYGHVNAARQNKLLMCTSVGTGARYCRRIVPVQVQEKKLLAILLRRMLRLAWPGGCLYACKMTSACATQHPCWPTHTYIHTHTHTHSPTFTDIHRHSHTHMHIHTHAHTYSHIHSHTSKHSHTFTHTHACAHAVTLNILTSVIIQFCGYC